MTPRSDVELALLVSDPPASALGVTQVPADSDWDSASPSEAAQWLHSLVLYLHCRFIAIGETKGLSKSTLIKSSGFCLDATASLLEVQSPFRGSPLQVLDSVTRMAASGDDSIPMALLTSKPIFGNDHGKLYRQFKLHHASSYPVTPVTNLYEETGRCVI